VKQGRTCVPKSELKGLPLAKTVSASEAYSLMKRRSLKNCLAAADIFEASADAMTADVKAAAALRLSAADAINCAMRIKGTGNIILVEGTVDSPDNKRFWGAHGARALRLARLALSDDRSLQNDARAKSVEIDAFLYTSSSKGIIRQALTGAGTEFKRLIDDFSAAHNSWDGGVGHCLVGGFYHVAPWPLGDKKRALVEMEAAWAVNKRSRRNGYYVCLLRYLAGDKSGALPACEAAQSARCDGGTEPDYCQFLTEQLNRVTALAKKR